ncbi:MAG: GAF domain-containing protein [Oscillospiraceae bacterium]|jgi:HD-GYP domain-containing protein (c-di-GMP phosphodiesterase class II)|nr:GAF domain-containing protein [Oscillospiraceae bacterium]
MKSVDTDKLLEVGIALSKQKDSDLLLETILNAAMDLTDCDGGTLYIKTDSALAFRTMITRSLDIHRNGKDEPITLPPVPLSPKNVCARAALDGVLINVPDVYNDVRYDFSGPREYDKLTGYRTVSMLVVPMEDDHGDIIGVLQLINAQNEDGSLTSFDVGYEAVISSLASQAAICLTNINYAAEVVSLLDSFVHVMSTAIDARSPYNANHTRNMAKYAGYFLDRVYGKSTNTIWNFTPERRRQFLFSVWLHDVGKLVTPLEIMDKESRLGMKLDLLEHRFEVLRLQNRIDLLDESVSPERFEARQRQLTEALDLIHDANMAGFLPDDKIALIRTLAEPVYETSDGTPIPLIDEEELIALSVRKGTLTADERTIMEEHVIMTAKMLDQMAFSRNYTNVPIWASMHHEYVNGQGYPSGLSGDEIPVEARLLTIIDIFDALTARDRPYKPAMPIDKAIEVLHSMVKDGQLDGEILELFIGCTPWEDEVL